MTPEYTVGSDLIDDTLNDGVDFERRVLPPTGKEALGRHPDRPWVGDTYRTLPW